MTLSSYNYSTIKLSNIRETSRLAKKLALLIVNLISPAAINIHLTGDLGSGKTTFIRFLLRECGISEQITSPSYILLESYKISNLEFHHIDFYRFYKSSEWIDTELYYLSKEKSVILIEWPELAYGNLPKPDLTISLSCFEKERNAFLTSQTDRGQKWIKKIISSYTNLNH